MYLAVLIRTRSFYRHLIGQLGGVSGGGEGGGEFTTLANVEQI